MRTLWIGILALVIAVSAFGAGFVCGQRCSQQTSQTFTSLLGNTPKPTPLQALSIDNLAGQSYQASDITIENVLAHTQTYTSYVFSYTTLGKKMTGVLNVPVVLADPSHAKTILMIRGYVPPDTYKPGVGTKNAAAVFAGNGYVTIAPDFFGYGGSDSEFSEEWQARFEKPVEVITLLKTLQEKSFVIPATIEGKPAESFTGTIQTQGIGIWAHSNGGQIALTTLEILGKSIPTTLWAPVTSSFPFSVLYFSDEDIDEGKSLRKSLANFEELYDVNDFSLTNHIDKLVGPIQIQHGSGDDIAPIAWSQAFVKRVQSDNQRRATLQKQQATMSAEVGTANLEQVSIDLLTRPGADHNMQPGWNDAVNADLGFFQKYI